MATTIKNVAIAGANGSVGKAAFKALVDSGKFNVTILRRNGSKSTYPEDTKVIDTDFNSIDSLKAALAGQDAIVSTVGAHGLGTEQQNLIDAAIAAGVQRFIPSEYGSDLDNPLARKLPVFGLKVQTQEYLKEKVKTSQLSYTFLYNSAFLDWGLQHDFILKVSDSKPIIYDGGESTFSVTNLGTVVDAIVSILLHPEETKNRSVHIHSIKVTQNKLLELAKKAAPERPWEPQEAKLDDIVAVADARLAQGLLDFETFAPYIFRSLFDPAYGSNFQKTDNELLGLKEVTEEDIVDILKKALKA